MYVNALYARMPEARGGQKRPSDPLKQEFGIVLSHHVGTRNWIPGSLQIYKCIFAFLYISIKLSKGKVIIIWGICQVGPYNNEAPLLGSSKMSFKKSSFFHVSLFSLKFY